MSQTVGGPLEEGSVRKRVGKACDRCRNKKSKVSPAMLIELSWFIAVPAVSIISQASQMTRVLQCDGLWPCNRCREDNIVCLFGERDKAHDKVWPKGTVELQQKALSIYEEAIIQLYNRALVGCPWDGPPVPFAGDNRPLLHGILASLGTCTLSCPIFNEVKEKVADVLDDEALSRPGKRSVKSEGDSDVKMESHDAGPPSINPSVQEHPHRPGPTPQEGFQEASYPSSPMQESTPRSAHKRRRAPPPFVELLEHDGGGNGTCHMPPQITLPTPNQSPDTEVNPQMGSSLGPLAYRHIDPQQSWHYSATAPSSGFPSYESTPLQEGSASYQDGLSEGRNYGWPNPDSNLGGDDQMLLAAMMNLPTNDNPYSYGEYPFEP